MKNIISLLRRSGTNEAKRRYEFRRQGLRDMQQGKTAWLQGGDSRRDICGRIQVRPRAHQLFQGSYGENRGILPQLRRGEAYRKGRLFHRGSDSCIHCETAEPETEGKGFRNRAGQQNHHQARNGITGNGTNQNA